MRTHFLNAWRSNKFILRQTLIASIAFVQCTNVGVILGFVSTLFAQLRSSHAVVLTTEEESWLASIPILVMVPISASSSWMLRLSGRRNCSLGYDLLNVISWLIILAAHDYNLLFLGRILQGIHMGYTYPTLIAFVGEISAPKYRSAFLSLIPLGSMVGVFIVQLLGEYISWRTIAIIFACPSIYNVIFMLASSESYVTYLESGQLPEAKTHFYYYRGDTCESQREFDAILNAITKEQSAWVVLKQCATKSFLVPFGITVLVFLTNEVSATQAVSFYAAQIVAAITTNRTLQFYGVLLLNALRIVAAIVSPRLVKLWSIRNVLLFSGFLLACSLLAMALFLYLSTVYDNNVIYSVVAVVLLIANAILYGVGLGPLPSVLCGEMFPPITRAHGCAWSSALSFLFLFFVVKFMPLSIASIGISGTFSLFGVCTLAGIIACYFLVPDTNNKTLQEINDLYLPGDNNAGD